MSERVELLQRIIEKRQQEEAERASQIEALQHIPSLRKDILDLIRKHVPHPKDQIPEVKLESSTGPYDDIVPKKSAPMFFRLFRLSATQLECTIPTEDNRWISASLISSGYPDLKRGTGRIDGGSLDALELQVDIKDLDQILNIKNPREAVVESKSRTSLPGEIVIGGRPRPTFPQWRRNIIMSDVENYKELLDELATNPDVLFTPKPFGTFDPHRSRC